MKKAPQGFVPYVIESSPRGERGFDIYSALLRERIVFLGMLIDDEVANSVIAQLLFLEREDPHKDISLYIHSPGGHVSAGLAIYDTMQLSQCDVATIAIGAVASMATVLLTAGTPGKRLALPHATIHIHQVRGGMEGQAKDIEIRAKEILRLNEVVKNLLAQHTGQTSERIADDFDRDHFFSAEAAKDYGLIDEILKKGSA